MKPALGVYFYTGTTQTGKTKRALVDARAIADALGWPVLIVDSQGVWNFASYPHAKSVEELVRRVWAVDDRGRPREPAIAFTPETPDEVELIFKAARAGRRVVLVCDEARYWLSARRMPDELSRALRTWAHSELVLLFTTQRLADIHGDALACHREIYVFRTVGRPDLETLWDEFEVKREDAEALAENEFGVIRWNKVVAWPRRKVPKGGSSGESGDRPSPRVAPDPEADAPPARVGPAE